MENESTNFVLEMIKAIMPQLILLVPLTTGLTEVLKRATNLPVRFLPLTSCVLGLGFSILIFGFSAAAAVVGVIAGLAGVGLWEVGSKTVESAPTT